MKIELDLTRYQALLLGRALGEWKEARGNKDYTKLAATVYEALAGIGIEETFFYPRVPIPPKKEEPKVHVCSARGHIWCLLAANSGKATLDDLTRIRNEQYPGSPKEDDLVRNAYKSGLPWSAHFVFPNPLLGFPKESDPELSLTVGQMKELFDNLVMEGFTKGEAASIVAQVARG